MLQVLQQLTQRCHTYGVSGPHKSTSTLALSANWVVTCTNRVGCSMRRWALLDSDRQQLRQQTGMQQHYGRYSLYHAAAEVDHEGPVEDERGLGPSWEQVVDPAVQAPSLFLSLPLHSISQYLFLAL